MDVLTLQAQSGDVLADKYCIKAGTLNMVAGNQASVLMDSVESAIKERMQAGTGYPYAVIDANGYVDADNAEMVTIWKYMSEKPRCVEALNKLLNVASSLFKDIKVDGKGEAYIHFGYHDSTHFADFKDMGELPVRFKNVMKVALKAFIASEGLVVLNNIEQVGAGVYEALIEYLTEMTIMRDNRTVISTQSMEAVKAYNSVMIKNSGLDSVMVTIVGSTPENCKILEQAKIEAELFNNMLGGVLTV